jgi:hypothetical protein
MTPQEISDKLKTQFPDSILEIKIEGVVDPYIKVAPEYLKDISVYLRDNVEVAWIMAKELWVLCIIFFR